APDAAHNFNEELVQAGSFGLPIWGAPPSCPIPRITNSTSHDKVGCSLTEEISVHAVVISAVVKKRSSQIFIKYPSIQIRFLLSKSTLLKTSGKIVIIIVNLLALLEMSGMWLVFFS
ncbi:MAG: hypothetical protein ACJAXM_001458, partial [Arenicella sp.]